MQSDKARFNSKSGGRYTRGKKKRDGRGNPFVRFTFPPKECEEGLERAEIDSEEVRKKRGVTRHWTRS